MLSAPFILAFAEKTKPVIVRGRYSKKNQTSVTRKCGPGSCEILATRPTHVETGTGGHNDTDTNAVED